MMNLLLALFALNLNAQAAEVQTENGYYDFRLESQAQGFLFDTAHDNLIQVYETAPSAELAAVIEPAVSEGDNWKLARQYCAKKGWITERCQIQLQSYMPAFYMVKGDLRVLSEKTSPGSVESQFLREATRWVDTMIVYATSELGK
jgi:hypothetical protein